MPNKEESVAHARWTHLCFNQCLNGLNLITIKDYDIYGMCVAHCARVYSIENTLKTIWQGFDWTGNDRGVNILVLKHTNTIRRIRMRNCLIILLHIVRNLMKICANNCLVFTKITFICTESKVNREFINSLLESHSKILLFGIGVWLFIITSSKKFDKNEKPAWNLMRIEKKDASQSQR